MKKSRYISKGVDHADATLDGKVGPSGRGLCRWCGKEVPTGRRTFCSAACVSYWATRKSSAALRGALFERDLGRCAVCGMECHYTDARLRRLASFLDPATQRRLATELGALPVWAQARFQQRKSFWEAHHTVAVAEGGGQSSLDTVITLCYGCHLVATKKLLKRLKG